MKTRDTPTLRPLKVEDAIISVSWRNNPIIWEKTINSPTRFITIKEENAWIKKVIADKKSYRFAIEVKSVYIGNVQLTNIENDESYFGIFLGDTNYWGRGIAKQATKIILDYGFNILKLKKIKLRVRSNHTVAHNMYLKLGFQEVDRNVDVIFMDIEKFQE
ncbi:MAG: GNAT family N-acetyltransferase [Flavobacteriaceae bacterium]|nr:GNAT family N-acetyltransferase [Flavobacteriaceae bacterium]